MAGKGGARPGAGRKKGSLSQKTLERMAAKKHFIQRVVKNTDRLFNAQLDKAVGEKLLFVKITEYDKNGKRKGSHTELVTDPETIIQYLDGALDDSGDEYYYITTEKADNMAISSLLDRAYGKATEKVEIGDGDESAESELTDEEIDERIQNYLRRRDR